MSRAGRSTARAWTALAGDRPVTRLGRLALFVLGGIAAASALAAPAIEVEPAEALEGQRVVVRGVGLAPGQPVTLHASRLFDRHPTGQEAYAAAQAQGWARLLAFLSRHLGPGS